MKQFNLKTIAAITAFGIIAILGTTQAVDAQERRQDDNREDGAETKRNEKADKKSAADEQKRETLDRERQASWTERNSQITDNRSQGMSNYNPNSSSSRYRVMRNGSYYNTDDRGAQLLRQAVSEGYKQGFNNARTDRNGNRNVGWKNSSTYKSGTMGYESHVNKGQYQYYFRQGFMRGYQDGSNSQYQNDHTGEYQYGSFENGSPKILEGILNSVLNLQSY